MNSPCPQNEVLSCKRCILTSLDHPNMVLDGKGVCDICLTYDLLCRNEVRHGSAGQVRINRLISKIQKSSSKQTYGCIVGVSGGADSSYLALLAKEWGLKTLLVHVDGGWNTEISQNNISKLAEFTGFDLFTKVLRWEQIRDLQRAFIKAHVLDIDLPFDNAYMASLYQTARKFGIRYILTGHNIITEGYLPPNFTYYKLDSRNIRALSKRFGECSLKGFPLMGPVREFIYSRLFRIQMINPLNWMPYNKSETETLLRNSIGWKDYGDKHCENMFTRFYQNYILFNKFGINKKKAHLQTLICSGQLSREEAKNILNRAGTGNDNESEEQEKAFFISKLGFTETEFDAYISAPQVLHRSYPSYMGLYYRLRPLYRMMRGNN